MTTGRNRMASRNSFIGRMLGGTMLIGAMLGFSFLLTACSKLPKSPLHLPLKSATAKPQPTQPSMITVEVGTGGPVVLTTSAAEFQVRPDGYVQAFLLKDGQKLSLDEPSIGAPADSDFIRIAGKDVHFTLDLQQAQVHEAIGKMGVGKRVEIPARPLGPSSGMDLQCVLAIEVYDQFPNTEHGGIQEQWHERCGHRKKRNSTPAFERAADRREGAAMGDVVVSWLKLRLGKR